MTTPARSSILRGPASIMLGGSTIYTQGDIKCSFAIETFPVMSAAYGQTDERLKDITIKLSFTPAGQWTTALLAVLYPWTNPTPGSSVFGATDAAVTLWPLNGTEKIVFTAGAVTKMPGLVLSATKTAYKEMEITCLLKNSADRSAADALYTLTATAAYTDATYAIAEIPTVPYTAAITGEIAAPWDSFIGEQGFEFDFNLKLNPTVLDGIGTVDMTHGGVDATCKLKPVGITVAQVLTRLKIQDTGVKIGMAMSSAAADLTVTGGSGNPIVVLKNARMKMASQIYGPQALRHDGIEFAATRPAGTGAIVTLGSVA
ncbi:MAG: hypothetical protein V1929_00330 [bacterium]